jgi:hypothetical protein
MKFDLISDIQLERRSTFPNKDELNKMLPCNSPNLIIAGDVGEASNFHFLIAFFGVCCSKYSHVFFVPGNHEFYSRDSDFTIEYICDALRDMENMFVPLHILMGDTVVFDEEKVVLHGCILWSRLPVTHRQLSIPMLEAPMRTPITETSWNVRHNNDVRGIQNAVTMARTKNYKCIVVTHYAPTYCCTLAPKYQNHPGNVFYCTEILALTPELTPDVWIFGHTGWNVKRNHRGVELVSNQYSCSEGSPPYTPEFFISL